MPSMLRICNSKRNISTTYDAFFGSWMFAVVFGTLPTKMSTLTWRPCKIGSTAINELPGYVHVLHTLLIIFCHIAGQCAGRWSEVLEKSAFNMLPFFSLFISPNAFTIHLNIPHISVMWFCFCVNWSVFCVTNTILLFFSMKKLAHISIQTNWMKCEAGGKKADTIQNWWNKYFQRLMHLNIMTAKNVHDIFPPNFRCFTRRQKSIFMESKYNRIKS